MSRVTKWAVAVLAAVGLGVGGGTATAQVPVGPFPGHGHHPRHADTDYVVLVRHHRHHDHWRFYGRYETAHEARWVERRLERHGFDVRVRPVRDHRGPYLPY